MSKEFAVLVANPCGTATWKKSSGMAPLGKRLAAKRAFTWAKVAVFPGLAVNQEVNSAWVTSVSVGTVPKPGGVLPILLKRKLGWLKAFNRSTLNWIVRFPSAPINGRLKFFWIEKSKYSCIGLRRFTVRGELPSEPLAGRMNAAGF